MNKTLRWTLAALGAAAVVAAAVAWRTGLLPGLGTSAKAAAQPAAAASQPGSQRTAGAGGKDQPPERALEFQPAEVVRPQRMTLADEIAFSGALVAPQTATLRARAGGTLAVLSVAEGDRVRAGQVLGRIEQAELATRIAERQAMVESARAALAQAERQHANNERLAAQQFISASALDVSRSAVETARAQWQAAQASLDTTRVGQRELQLVAPIAGIVARRPVLPGEQVSPEQPLLTLVDLARLELAATVGTHEVGRLTPGMPVQLRVEGVAEPVQGRLARIAPAAEAGTRSIGVTVAVPNPQERLRAGQYAMARVELRDPQPRLTLPLSAVGQTSGQDHVWLIENGRLARRAVTLGRRDERQARVELLQGVSGDSTVLAARFDNLREGALATVVGAQPGPGSALEAAPAPARAASAAGTVVTAQAAAAQAGATAASAATR